jgi:nitrite reductase/ring-hydroxylating ferredoxin subunit
MKELNRREFVAAAACAACLLGMGGLGGDFSHALADEPSTQPGSTLDVGAKSDYAKDGITTTWIGQPNRVIVIRHEGKIYASTSICPHRQVTIVEGADHNSFECPRHHSKFDIDGNVTQGPAKKALVRYAISVDANGHLIVDKSKKFTDTQWDDPASFVAVS